MHFYIFTYILYTLTFNIRKNLQKSHANFTKKLIFLKQFKE